MPHISPIVAISICWILGNVVIGTLTIVHAAAIILCVLLLLLVAMLLGNLKLRLMSILLLCLLLGAASRYWVDMKNTTQLQSLVEAEQLQSLFIVASGVISSPVEIDGNRVNFDLLASSIAIDDAETYQLPEKLKIQMTLQAQSELTQARGWVRGTSIQLIGELTRPSSATNDGGFDYQRFLYYQHIHWLLKVKGASNAKVLQQEIRPSLYSAMQLIDVGREKLAAPFDDLFEQQESGYLKGLILGIREELDPEQFRQFSTLGLTHILAISGLHVAVFMYILTALLRILRFSKERIIFTLLILIPFYVLFTGGSPSIVRAGIMAMLGLIAAKMQLLKNGLSLIAVTALVLVMVDPYMVHNISFQLSFIVTLGLIIGVPPLSKLWARHKNWKWLTDLLAVTLVAQLVSFPLSIYYFNQFHLLSLLANLILVPFISFIVMPLASAALGIAHISVTAAKPFAVIVRWCNEVSFLLVEWLSRASKLHMIWATPAIWWIIVWYSLLLWAVSIINSRNQQQMLVNLATVEPTAPLHGVQEYDIIFPLKNKRRNKLYNQLLACPIITLLLLLYGYYPYVFTSAAAVSFIDVGQGDASYIRSATGKHILIDGGGTIRFQKNDEVWKIRQDPFEVGKDVLVPLLMKRGVHQLDLLVLSHLDTDHIGGLIEVVRSIPIKEIWWNGSYRAHENVDELFSLVLQKGITLRTPLVGETIMLDKHTKIDILWPLEAVPTHLEEQDNQNEHSLVLLFHLYQHTFLYTGDIGADTEEMLVAKWHEEQQPAISIDVMKVAHHGSRHSTSYSWLSYFEPKISVISVGKYNTYGHPHPSTISRLEDYDSIVLRTDLSGEVKIGVQKHEIFYINWK